MITAVSIAKRYGAERALAPLDLVVEDGAFLVITGRNGSGKTTLLRILAGLSAPTSGTITSTWDRREVGYLGHEPLVYRQLSARENLALYARLYRISDPARRAGQLLDEFGLGAAADGRVATFSRGMTQRLALCRALLHRPGLLVLDEPHTALDDEGAALLDDRLASLRPTTTIVAATHDPARLAALTSDNVRLAR